MDEERLAGGNLNAEVLRIGQTVRREAGPWTPGVHDLLTHLQSKSYPAPVPHGLDASGREVLSFIPGNPVHPDNLHLLDAPRSMFRVGRLIADYHIAQADFDAPPTAEWRGEGSDPSGSTEVLAHNDLAPWNLIAGPTGWVFIDWDLAAPGRRMWDLAWALHSFVGLWPDSPHDDEELVTRILAFCEGANVEPLDRRLLLETVVERTGGHAAFLRAQAKDGAGNYRRLVDEGHADRWEQGAQFVENNLDRWSELLV